MEPSRKKARRVIVEVDENGHSVASSGSSVSTVSGHREIGGSDMPMTQVCIEHLKEDIAEVKTLMAPAESRKLSPNQAAIRELREIVRKLKSKLDTRENDILYLRSMDHDNDVKVLKLRREIRLLKKENANLKAENREYSRILFEKRNGGF